MSPPSVPPVNFARPAPNDDGELPSATAQCADLANAERLVGSYGDEIRYCARWAKWLTWDGRRWAVDETGAVRRMAMETARRMFGEALVEHARASATSAADPGDEAAKAAFSRAKRALAWAMTSQGATRLEAMVRLASAFEGVVIEHTQLDADPWLFNVGNGTIDLRRGVIRPHRREDLLSKLSDVTFDAGAQAPTWMAFLDRIMGDRPELVAFLGRLVGYALSGVIREHVLVFLFGTGANGKSVFLSVLHAILGEYGVRAPRGLLFMKGGERHPTELTVLFGARMATCAEIQKTDTFDEALVKDLTGGDLISARRMHEDFWTFAPTHTLFLAGNHKPKVKGTDEGIWRRLRLIPFEVTIPAEERDSALTDKLRAELAGILAWAVRGCLEWQRDGLGDPAAVRRETDRYRVESDPIGDFATERLVFRDDAKVPRAALRGAYDEWCKENGERFPLGAKAFADALKARGVTDGGSVRIPTKITPVNAWSGVRLRVDGEQTEPVGRKSVGTAEVPVSGLSSILDFPPTRGPENSTYKVHTESGADPDRSFGDWLDTTRGAS